VDGTGSGSCPVSGFGINDVEPWVHYHRNSSSVNQLLVYSQ
jgi:hypothetical protein